MKFKHVLVASTFLSALTCGSAMAQYTVKLGYGNINPNSSASEVTGPFTPTGLSLNVRPQSTLLMSLSKAIDDNWDVELALGLPPKHDVELKVNNAALPASAQALNGRVGAVVTQIAPTLFANYKFFDKASTLRPFVGVGINYTKFSPADSTADGNALNGGPTALALEDSIGLALQGGVIYQIDSKWSLTASVATADVKTKLTTNTGGIVRTADIKFRPTVLSVVVGYSF